MTGAGEVWRLEGGRIALRVRLTPKASRDDIDGIEVTAEGPAVKARVRAVPQDGAANAALERLIADWLDLPKRDVQLARGGKSRVKTITIAGDAGEITRRIGERLAQATMQAS